MRARSFADEVRSRGYTMLRSVPSGTELGAGSDTNSNDRMTVPSSRHCGTGQGTR